MFCPTRSVEISVLELVGPRRTTKEIETSTFVISFSIFSQGFSGLLENRFPNQDGSCEISESCSEWAYLVHLGGFGAGQIEEIVWRTWVRYLFDLEESCSRVGARHLCDN
jgi:hypothetical protein